MAKSAHRQFDDKVVDASVSRDLKDNVLPENNVSQIRSSSSTFGSYAKAAAKKAAFHTMLG